MKKLEIPRWEDLDKWGSITSNKECSSNSSITSNSIVNEVFEVKQLEESNYSSKDKLDIETIKIS